ncbi:hypothetical protein EZS27_025190 [termite gut metagenome]|uniref:Uncharacterized protein n=1 Tax=termite gut metagenome TaxID=433724 RepID=A0A5J4QY31_9ZZZZ
MQKNRTHRYTKTQRYVGGQTSPLPLCRQYRRNVRTAGLALFPKEHSNEWIINRIFILIGDNLFKTDC